MTLPWVPPGLGHVTGARKRKGLSGELGRAEVREKRTLDCPFPSRFLEPEALQHPRCIENEKFVLCIKCAHILIPLWLRSLVSSETIF